MAINKFVIGMDETGSCSAEIEGNQVDIIRAIVELMIVNKQVHDLIFMAYTIYIDHQKERKNNNDTLDPV